MSVYRQSRDKSATPKAPQEGPVAEMVRQFADPYAFLRELVQNAIDAGASAIDVRAELGTDNEASFTVSDNGSGMDRATIEGPLLTLFRSSKEGDDSKIGRYGVGFVSVFAIQPEVVIVTTSTASESWVLRLFPDHSYELEQPSERSASQGTSVRLVKRAPLTEFNRHAAACEASLRRWCRHAPIPIRFSTADWQGKESASVRIDRPMGLRAAVSVTHSEGAEHFIVGPTAGSILLAPAQPGEEDGTDGGDFAGFYNRGLMLMETDQVPRPLRGLRCKVLSPNLQHTISRDDVRRNDAFDRVVDQVLSLARARLRGELALRLKEQALLVASGAQDTHYVALIAAAWTGEYKVDADEITLALTDAVDGSTVASVSSILWAGRDLGVLVAPSSCALSAAFASRGHPVVRCESDALTSGLAALLHPAAMVSVSGAFVLLQEDGTAGAVPSDRDFCDATHRALRAAGASLERVTIARCEGATGAIAFAADGQGVGICDCRAPKPWWKRWRGRTTLWLDADNPIVREARSRATFDPSTAGILLARLLLLHARGVMDPRAHDRLLAAWHKGDS
ncbi:MAG: ATP-binding protein [Deltaproteobacteria bacterium]|nr:ATP-binding protein [Deltaproteobacteria bacterium]